MSPGDWKHFGCPRCDNKGAWVFFFFDFYNIKVHFQQKCLKIVLVFLINIVSAETLEPS